MEEGSKTHDRVHEGEMYMERVENHESLFVFIVETLAVLILKYSGTWACEGYLQQKIEFFLFLNLNNT